VRLATGNLLWIKFALIVEKCQLSKKVILVLVELKKLHAVTQKVKCTKTKGTVVKGKYHYHKFIHYLNSINH
jgi:hypothetical protein